jgi:hypothetical protein
MHVQETAVSPAAARPRRDRPGDVTLEELTRDWRIVKRDGRREKFLPGKVKGVVNKCLHLGLKWPLSESDPVAERIAARVVNLLDAQGFTEPDVEQVQQAVIHQLWSDGQYEAAEHFTLYREERRKAREQRKVPQHVVDAIREDAGHFPTPLQAYQFYSKFARWRDQDQRRETWRECNDRVFDWFATLPAFSLLSSEEVGRLRRMMFDFEVSPAMRVVQMAGPALQRCHIGTFNCAALPILDLKCFAELLYVLMQGSGCGFSVENDYVCRLPRVRRRRRRDDASRFVIDDTTEAWCDALYVGLCAWFDGRDVEYDYSRVRAAGVRLKTKGGRASGPEPLRELLDYARRAVLSAQGRRLTDVEVHDLCCKIGRIVQVGGVRRAACISLSDLDSVAMREAKHGAWWDVAAHRSMANNSAVYDYDGLPPIDVFMAEMTALIKGRSGERGIFSRRSCIRNRPKRRKAARFQINPCAEIILRPFGLCVCGDTRLITRSGLVKIGESIGREIEVWNGKRWARVTPFQTGSDRQLVRVTFSDGSFLDCTPEHRFSVNTADSRHRKGHDVWQTVEAKDLRPRMATETFTMRHGDGGRTLEDAYTVGVAMGDGSVEKNGVNIDLYGAKIDLPVVGSRYKERIKPGYSVPCVRVAVGDAFTELLRSLRADDESVWSSLFSLCRRSILEFLAGWFDADGSDTESGGVRLYVAGRLKADMAQLLLTRCGIRSSVNLMSRAGEETNFGVRSTDVWYVQVTDCGELPCHRLDVGRGHHAEFKGKYQVVTSVEYLPGLHDTFCFEEPQEHKGVFNNTLTHQCNLSIAIVRGHESVEQLRDKVIAATYFGVLQSTATTFRYVRDAWRKNAEEERLLGVDLMGHLDHPLLRPGAGGREELVLRLKRDVCETALLLSLRFGIPYSAANTCLKPGGDSGVFFHSCTLGGYPAQYQLRRVREPVISPVARMLRDAGVGYEVDVMNPELAVLTFPRKNPDGCVTEGSSSAVEQLENWLFWKKTWAEHSCAVTVHVREREWPAVLAWLYQEDHFSHLSGVSFLPYDGHTYPQTPNERLTKEQYDKAAADFPEIDWSKLMSYESEDMTTSATTYACVAGSCET